LGRKMASTVPIWIPCEAFDVTLAADDDEPTDLEKAVMLFLAWRDDLSLDEVLHFLGLSQRLTMDLLTGLWRLGYILVDTMDGGIRLDAPWKRLVEQGKWSEIKTAHRVSDTVAMMRELVSGQLVGDRSSRMAPPPADAAPILVPTSLVEGVSRTDLAIAALRGVRQNSPLHKRQRKIRAELSKSKVGSTVRNITWLRLEFEGQMDAESDGSLTVRPVANDDVVLARIAPGIANALGEWALGNPNHPVVRALLTSATTAQVQPRGSLEAKIQALTKSIGAAADDPIVSQHHLETWAEDLSMLSAEIETLESARGKVALYTPGQHHASFMDIAMNFDHQLVLASPLLDTEGLENCSKTLIPRLKQSPSDASAILLWGGRKQRQLAGRSSNFLANLTAETTGAQGARFLSSSRSSRIATSFAVIDGRDVIFCSAAPLASDQERDRFTFMLKIEPGARSTLARRLLEIARNRSPSVAMAERIELHPWVPFQDDTSPGQTAEQRLRDTEPKEDEVEYAPSQVLAMKARLHDLRQDCQVAASRLASVGTTAEVLVDAAVFHRGLDIAADTDSHSAEPTLWLGFGRDDHLGRSAPLHRRLAAAVEQRAAAGLATLVLVDDEQAGATVDIRNLRHLADTWPGLVSIVSSPGLPCHFACGEYRFLVTPGGLASPPIMEARGSASRLIGFSVADKALCANFREALIQQWPEVGKLAPTVGRQRAPLGGQTAIRVATTPSVAAWRAATLRHRRSALADTLEDDEGRFKSELAQALLELTSKAHEDEIVAFRGDLLAVVSARGTEGLRSRALGELAEAAWRNGHWQQAALMLDPQSGSTSSVPTDLAIAMATTTVGATPDLHAALDRDDTDSWMAVVALAIWAVLFNGDAETAEALEVKLFMGDPPHEAKPLATIAGAVLGYWSAMGDKVDAGTIASMSRRAEAESELASRARAFAEAFRLGINRSYDNSMLKRVVPRFYANTSGLRPVVDLIPQDGVPLSWEPILRGLHTVFGEGAVNTDALSDKLFEKAHREYAWPNDPPLMYAKGAAIRSATRAFMRRALALRDAIRSSNAVFGRASPALEQLVIVLRRETRSLDLLVRVLPPEALARSILVQLLHRLDQLMGAKQ